MRGYTVRVYLSIWCVIILKAYRTTSLITVHPGSAIRHPPFHGKLLRSAYPAQVECGAHVYVCGATVLDHHGGASFTLQLIVYLS
jgi:hypothetical protein